MSSPMSGSGPGPISPTRMSKAAFFRARSPPIVDRPSPNDISARLDLQARISDAGPSDGRYSVESPSEGRGAVTQNGMNGHGYPTNTTGVAGSFAQPRLGRPPMAPSSPHIYNPGKNMSNGGGGGGGDYLQHRVEEDVASEEEMMPESASMGMAGGSDEMLMSLLASQAAVDCETLPIGGWEEVESWKKVCSAPSIPVGAHTFVEQTILTCCETSEGSQDPYCGEDIAEAE